MSTFDAALTHSTTDEDKSLLMHSTNAALLPRLAAAVDETLRFYRGASQQIIRPSVRSVFDELAQSHQLVTVELCKHTARCGGDGTLRHDGNQQRWRRAWLDWRIRNHFDSDLAYVEHGARYELRLARQFDRATRRRAVSYARDSLMFGLRAADRARSQLRRTVAELEHDIDSQVLTAFARRRQVDAAGTARLSSDQHSETHAQGAVR